MCSPGRRTGSGALTRSRCSTPPVSRSRTSPSVRRSTSAGGRVRSMRRWSASEAGCRAPLLLALLLRGGRAMPAVLLLLAFLRLLVRRRAVIRRGRQWPAIGERHVVEVIGFAGLPIRADVRDHCHPIGRADQGDELSLAGGMADAAGI